MQITELRRRTAKVTNEYCQIGCRNDKISNKLMCGKCERERDRLQRSTKGLRDLEKKNSLIMIIIIICESAKNEVVEDEDKKTSSSKLIVAIFQHFFQFKSDIRIYF